MSDAQPSKLREVLDDITPKLDYALSEGPLNDQVYMGDFKDLPQDIIRRGGICNATSWLLSNLLRKENIYSSPNFIMRSVRHGDKECLNYHVLLKLAVHENRYVDPTSQQYYRYVGLASGLVKENPELAELYPDNDIAIIHPENTDFQENFATNAHRIELELAKRGVVGGMLAGSTLEEKVDVYKQVWNMEAYRPLSQTGNGLLKAVAHSSQLIDRLKAPVE